MKPGSRTTRGGGGHRANAVSTPWNAAPGTGSVVSSAKILFVVPVSTAYVLVAITGNIRFLFRADSVLVWLVGFGSER